MNIRLIPQAEIDRLKWDSCVHFAHNGNPYAYTWYLNNIAKEWDGLVEGAYESVMPILHRRHRMGQQELYQPDLIPFAGIYSVRLLAKSRAKAFLDAIPDQYQKIKIKLPQTSFAMDDLGFQHSSFDNHLLLLDQGWETVKANYSEALKERLTKVQNSGLYPGNAIKVEKIAELYLKWGKAKQKEQKAHAYQRILYNIMHRGTGFNSSIMNANGEICAVGAFMYSHGKIISLVFVQKPDSEGELAGAYLHDLIVEKHAGNPMILDFSTETGNPWGEAFGAKPIPHHVLEKNNLPWWAKLVNI